MEQCLSSCSNFQLKGSSKAQMLKVLSPARVLLGYVEPFKKWSPGSTGRKFRLLGAHPGRILGVLPISASWPWWGEYVLPTRGPCFYRQHRTKVAQPSNYRLEYWNNGPKHLSSWWADFLWYYCHSSRTVTNIPAFEDRRVDSRLRNEWFL